MNDEFDIIRKYFTFSETRSDVILAGGDDCAIISPPENNQLLITTDTLISGVHFPESSSARDIAYKSLMVNLSDLAAMGATPAWITLAITLPDVNDDWLQAFSDQLKALLSKFNISLIGGDTTKGPLSITIQAMGYAEDENILKRNQACTGDKIYVTGYLGDAAIGLDVVLNAIIDEKLDTCVGRLNRPVARVDFAEELASLSKCAVDISDGLVADLGHVLVASQCGARLKMSAIPLSKAALYYFEKYNNNVVDWMMVMSHGDDYELCFTVKNSLVEKVESIANKHKLKISCVGEITDTAILECINDNGEVMKFSNAGFKHF